MTVCLELRSRERQGRTPLTFAPADRGARASWVAFWRFQGSFRLIRSGDHSPSAAEHLVRGADFVSAAIGHEKYDRIFRRQW
ncbi:MAG: hypothetical protein B1H05_04985 [Candidatus Cloacimonas sp. 4484_140]|nr:MAG: hypothetical protein B1H05_04985 [Candidatus Cloacimonas sp. 4484_140]